MTRLSNIFWPVLGVGFGLAMQPALAAVGARVLVQVWNPLTPKQQSVQVLLDDKSLVTDQIQKAWTQARPQICASFGAAPSVQNKTEQPAINPRALAPSTLTPAQMPSALH